MTEERRGDISTTERRGRDRAAPKDDRSLREEARAKADEVKDEAKAKAREARREAEERADRVTSSVGRRASRLARALDAAAEHLREDGEGAMAGMADAAARQVDRIGGYLDNEDPSAMLEDFEDLGRRNPGTFLGSAFTAGLMAGRFLRSSGPDGNGHASDVRSEPTADIAERPVKSDSSTTTDAAEAYATSAPTRREQGTP